MKMMREIKTITVGNLKLAYIEKGDGPLVLCLHGYPDTAHTWQGTMAFLTDKGFRVIAPFLRGYHPSGIPENGDYSVLTLAEEMVSLLEQLDEDEVIIIGHDWGALIGYAMAQLIPNKMTKLVTLDMAHPRSLQFSLKTVWKGRHILTYQMKKRAVARMKRNRFAHLDEIYRRWSPNWEFGMEETAVVKQAFAHPGRVEAALGYYWSMMGDLRGKDARSAQSRAISLAKTPVSTLCIVGDWGGISTKQMTATPAAFSGDYTYVILPNVGHFLHREAPEQFYSLLDNFLGEPK